MMCLLLELNESQPDPVQTILGLRTDRRTSRYKDHTTRTSTTVSGMSLISLQVGHKKDKGQTCLVEVWYLSDVAEVDDGKVLHFLGDGVERLVHDHALGVPVVPKADNHDAVFF